MDITTISSCDPPLSEHSIRFYARLTPCAAVLRVLSSVLDQTLARTALFANEKRMPTFGTLFFCPGVWFIPCRCSRNSPISTRHAPKNTPGK
jgi:hypothetical protein